ncbi:Rieske (2Fe-2S) protein [Cytobacillus sp. NJ13]|nr:Rieske (2Fe-2S) protein [Cytobacillus sp. NJ13]
MAYCAGELSQISEKEAFITDLNGISVGIFLINGKVYAVRNACPHKLAPICKGTVCGTMIPSRPSEFVFGLEGKVLKCPWHGWEFSLETGYALFGISNRKVKTYPAEVKDGMIYIEMG